MYSQSLPEQGQLVQTRNRFFLVQEINVCRDYELKEVTTKLTLECIDDDRLGDTIDLIWELEVNKSVHRDISFPAPDKWDSFNRFDAFNHGISWSCSSLVEGSGLQSPFRGAIELESYQFEPVIRAITMPRVNLLIADDVGLGKTIEAGLVVQELLARQRIRRIMVICPASLMKQWQEEMLEKFNLEFKVIDRDAIHRLRKEYGVRVNPWNSFPRLITSMDFIKREQNLRTFKNSLNPEGRRSGLRDWDLLIVDEAHNLAPSGRKEYVKDSDRTLMAREIVNDFEHRLFLTATPHNGYTHSFTALLEMLDPLRFSRGPTIDPNHRDLVMIRRMKEDVVRLGASRKFAKREVKKIEIDLPLTEDNPERRLFKFLDLYRESRLRRTTDRRELIPIQFALTLLKKRLLSSPLAFCNSLEVHLNNITRPEEEITEEKRSDEVLFKNLQHKYKEDWDDDIEKSAYEEQALQESSKFFGKLTEEEDQWLMNLWDISSDLKQKADSKAKELVNWIKENLFEGNSWKNDRLIIFTEYKDTLEYLGNILKRFDGGGRIFELYGGMTANNREQIKSAFQAAPTHNPVRILLATDAASEGLNLQNYCRYLIHYEIPWNPNKMEQRNGRIDRHGQKFPAVFCHHFVYTHHEDSEFLHVIVNKMQTQRADLGGIGDLIEREVEKKMLGDTKINDYDHRVKRVKEEIKADTNLELNIQRAQAQILEAKEALDYRPEMAKLVVEQALKLTLNRPDFTLEEIKLSKEETAYLLRDIPRDWNDVHQALHDHRGRLRPIIFDPVLLKDRKHIALIHLSHPLMRRAIGVFRANMWSIGPSSNGDLSRVSYKVIRDNSMTQPALIGVGRLVISNTQGQKLHEDLVYVGGVIKTSELELMNPNRVKEMYRMKGLHSPIPTTIANRLRAWFPSHQTILQKGLRMLKQQEEQQIRNTLNQKAKEEANQIQRLIKERMKEIKKRLDQASQEKAQLVLDFESEQQYNEDIKWLERKLDKLTIDLGERPETVKNQYKMRHSQIYPVGLLYLLPESYLKANA